MNEVMQWYERDMTLAQAMDGIETNMWAAVRNYIAGQYHNSLFEGGMELSLIKALVVSMAISAVWYGMEWMQYQELQWDRKCDNVVWALYLVVLWWLFAHQN